MTVDRICEMGYNIRSMTCATRCFGAGHGLRPCRPDVVLRMPGSFAVKRMNGMKHIMIVDDDVHIGNLLQEVLEREGYRVSRAYSGTEALLLLGSCTPDMVLLDLMLPGLSGEELLPRIGHIPVIVLSAKADTADKVGLLLGGAVDYVTKPFDLGELLARIQVHLRGSTCFSGQRPLKYEGLTLDPDTHIATAGERQVRLTRTEYAILKLLMRNPTQVITKSLLLDRISEDTPDCTDSSLKMHISNLRRKLREVSGRDYIEAVWGIGFKLRSAQDGQSAQGDGPRS